MKSWQDINNLLSVDLIYQALQSDILCNLLIQLGLDDVKSCKFESVKPRIWQLVNDNYFRLKIWALGLDKLNNIVKESDISQLIEKLSINPDQLLPNYNIPKKVHWIWLGSQLPIEYEKNLLTFIKLNKDYSFHLWIDSAAIKHAEISSALLAMQKFCQSNCIELHDIACRDKEPNFAHVLNAPCYNDWLQGLDSVKAFSADYLRIKILDIVGGVYVDVDAECLVPLGSLNNQYGFACLLKHYSKDGNPAVEVADNYFIASAARHPLLKICIQEMEMHYSTFMLEGYSFQSIFSGQDVVHDLSAKRANPLVFKRFNNLCASESSESKEEQINYNKIMEFAYRNYRFLEPGNLGYKLRFVGTLVLMHSIERLLKQFYEPGAIYNLELSVGLIKHHNSRSWAKMSGRILGVLDLDGNRVQINSLNHVSV